VYEADCIAFSRRSGIPRECCWGHGNPFLSFFLMSYLLFDSYIKGWGNGVIVSRVRITIPSV
jgi:hypothetical protein